MPLKVDDILITDKNVFVLSGDKQMVADIESVASTADFAESIDVNPWNLYTSDGKLISNLYDSSAFLFRTQILKNGSKLSPRNKRRHEEMYMPNAGSYCGMCQVGDIGYSLSNPTTSRFHAKASDSFDYEALPDYCQYYYLSSVAADDSDTIAPDLTYHPNVGVQYVTEFPMGKYYSDFGDNELDEDGTLIDVPTVFSDSFLTKYFYDENFSVNGHTDDGQTISFDNFRTYYGIGHTGDTLYMVFRNNLRGTCNEYGFYRPKQELNLDTVFDLWTLGRISGIAAAVSKNVTYTRYRTYLSYGFNDYFSTFALATSDSYCILRSFEPKDESFILYAMAGGDDESEAKHLAKYNRVTQLCYIPKVGGFSTPYYYKFKHDADEYGEIRGELLDNMTFIELESSVFIGTRNNGSINVVSRDYGYVNPLNPDETSEMSFDPFIGPRLGSCPQNPGYVGLRNPSFNDTDGRTDVFYNGEDILAVKKYFVSDETTSCKIYLSKDFTDTANVKYPIGNYFAATFHPSSEIPSSITFDGDLVGNSLVGFTPIFDYSPISIGDFDGAFVLKPESKTKRAWRIDDSHKLNGFNSIRMELNGISRTTYATMEVPAPFKITFSVALREFFGHNPLRFYDSVDYGAFTVKKVFSHTKSGSYTEGVGGSEKTRKDGTITFQSYTYEASGNEMHTLKWEYMDTCEGGPCEYDFGLISNITLASTGGKYIFDIKPDNIVQLDDGDFELQSKSSFSVDNGSYVFIQYDDGTVGMCSKDDIFRDENRIPTRYCGPSNKSESLTAAVGGEIPICREMKFTLQTNVSSAAAKTVSEITFPLASYKSLDKFTYAESALLGTYSLEDGDKYRYFQTFTLLPIGVREPIAAFFGSASADIEQVGISNHTYVNGYPIDRSNAVSIKSILPHTPLHDAGPVLVKWNTDDGTCVLDDDFYSDSASSNSLGGLCLQYGGISYEFYIEGCDKYSSYTQDGWYCMNGIWRCSNHPIGTPGTVASVKDFTSMSHDRRGYAYPIPSYWDFITAGTGLKVFEGKLDKSMTLDDIQLVNNYLVVKNYSVNAESVTEGDIPDGGRGYDNPVPKYPTGGYVVVNLNSSQDMRSTQSLYEIEKVMSSGETLGSNFRYLFRIAPKKGLHVYPASNEGEEWKPFYAGYHVEFVKYHDGFYYISLSKEETGKEVEYFELIETNSLLNEKTPVSIGNDRRVEDIRFFDGVIVVEYSIPVKDKSSNEVIWTSEGLQWFYSGMSVLRHYMEISTANDIIEMNPTNVNFEKCGKNIVGYSGNIFTTISLPDAGAPVTEKLIGNSYVYSEKSENGRIIDMENTNGMAYSAQNRGNYILRYSSAQDDAELTSEYDNEDELVPLSGIANLFDEAFLFTDDKYSETADGNGIKYKAINEPIKNARIVKNLVETRDGDNNVIGVTFDTEEITSGCYTFINSFETTGNDRFCLAYDKSRNILLVSRDYEDINGYSFRCGELFSKIDTASAVDVAHLYYLNPGSTKWSAIDAGIWNLTDNKNCIDFVAMRSSNSYPLCIIDYRKTYGSYGSSNTKYPYETVPATGGTFVSTGINLPDSIINDGERLARTAFLSGNEFMVFSSGSSCDYVYKNGVKCDYPDNTDGEYRIHEFIMPTGRNAIVSGFSFIANDEKIGSDSYHLAYVSSVNGSPQTLFMTDAASTSAFTFTNYKIMKDGGRNIRSVLFYDENLAINGYYDFTSGNKIVYDTCSAVNSANSTFTSSNSSYTVLDMDLAYNDRYLYFGLLSRTTPDERSVTEQILSSAIYGSGTSAEMNSYDNSGFSYDTYINTMNMSSLFFENYSADVDDYITRGQSSKSAADGEKEISRLIWTIGISSCPLVKLVKVRKDDITGQISTITCSGCTETSGAVIGHFTTLITHGLSSKETVKTAGCSGTDYWHPLYPNTAAERNKRIYGSQTRKQPIYFRADKEEIEFSESNSWTHTYETTTMFQSMDGFLKEVGDRTESETKNISISGTPTYSTSSVVTTSILTVCPQTYNNYSISVHLKTIVPAIFGYSNKILTTATANQRALSASTSNNTVPATANLQQTKAISSYSFVRKPIEFEWSTTVNLTGDDDSGHGFDEYKSSNFTFGMRGFDGANLPIVNPNPISVSVVASNSIPSLFGNSNILELNTYEEIGSLVVNSSNKSFIRANGNRMVFGVGNHGMWYMTADRVAGSASLPYGIKISDNAYAIAMTMTDLRTDDPSVSLHTKVDEYQGENVNSFKTYDNVEAVYSLNRFTSQNIHKSNLFSVRIDGLGIDDSPYLTDEQKRQLSVWIKNHVTDIVDGMKPAQTELFDVILS